MSPRGKTRRGGAETRIAPNAAWFFFALPSQRPRPRLRVRGLLGFFPKPLPLPPRLNHRVRYNLYQKDEIPHDPEEVLALSFTSCCFIFFDRRRLLWTSGSC